MSSMPVIRHVPIHRQAGRRGRAGWMDCFEELDLRGPIYLRLSMSIPTIKDGNDFGKKFFLFVISIVNFGRLWASRQQKPPPRWSDGGARNRIVVVRLSSRQQPTERNAPLAGNERGGVRHWRVEGGWDRIKGAMQFRLDIWASMWPCGDQRSDALAVVSPLKRTKGTLHNVRRRASCRTSACPCRPCADARYPAAESGDLATAVVFAGEGTELINDLAPGGEIVTRLVAEAERALIAAADRIV